MIWNSKKAAHWLKTYADDIAADAFDMGGDDTLYSCAGCAYYAMSHGVGYKTKADFSELILKHMRLSEDFLEEALYDIEHNY